MKTLIAGAAALFLIIVLAMGGSLMLVMAEDEAQADEEESGLTLNLDLIPDPADPYVPWMIRSAEQCDGLSPGVIAAQLQQESNFNAKAKGPETYAGRAIGIAQFLPETYATYGRDSDGDGNTGPSDPQDAIMAQGKYMCSLISRAKKSNYAGKPIHLALAGYNAGWGNVQKYGGIPPFQETTQYVSKITKNAKKFAKREISGDGDGAKAVRKASSQLGVPYSWGGGTPSGKSTGFCDGTNGYLRGECDAEKTAGFDCSSLTQYAYWSSKKLPRVAQDQYDATAGNTVKKSDLKTGDLVFWKNDTGIYHVALYHKDGKVLHAPRTGKKIEIVDMDKAMPKSDYYGATRPS